MENINTFENFDDSYVYLKVPDDHILIDIDVCDEIDFPVKDHSSAARRKKTFVKGKKRYDLARHKGFTPYPENESVLRGMMRKTCVINADIWKSASHFKSNQGTVRRRESVNDKLNEYVMEA